MKQAALLEFLAQTGRISSIQARKETGCQPETVRTLVNKGLIRIDEIEVKRQPVSYDNLEYRSR
jgi:primosomal protein N'